MYTFDWKPQDVDSPILDENGVPILDENGNTKSEKKSSPFEGSIKIRLIKHQERMNLVKQYQTFINEKGEVVKRDNLELSAMMMDLAVKHIEEVKLKRKQDNLEINEVEWLEYDEDGASVLRDIGGIILKGARLGKN